jgi:hypothetical protein
VTPDGKLVEAWLGPISLLLYPILFSRRPQVEAERVAGEVYAATQPGHRSIFRSFTSEQLRDLLAEVRLELEHPSQRVRDILDLPQDEAALREYLALVANRLAELMRDTGSDTQGS